ncbi:VanZ family protein [Curtobacterium poinsettiae]|uniref:VanZ family protein n=1 Tax=Curtobacterium poinsettiae TaxID=159612 RepID=A0ABT3S615_9MICO|nr:VanZ family protein [Curtobacterium flaccumfaciens]MBT1611359.1 VanZ family protein [Curtobacterium flaccumfaciens pv. poinsettiae]MCX2849918.1 VanZ family protein [Curtobacterium flaccumfaciens pv. poinsettiae]UXN19523.1 VanZ family protein [Curtobacterium flaccumfaciens pv. poinsettiae]
MTSDKPRVDDRAPATWRSRRFATGLAVAYGVALALVGFWGSPVDASGGLWLTRALAAAHRHGLPDRIDYAAVESFANVVYFVPLGLLVVLLAGARWWWAAIATGLVVSACIETGQALFLPARTATIDDVVANGVGALLGAVAGVLLLSRAAQRR